MITSLPFVRLERFMLRLVFTCLLLVVSLPGYSSEEFYQELAELDERIEALNYDVDLNDYPAKRIFLMRLAKSGGSTDQQAARLR